MGRPNRKIYTGDLLSEANLVDIPVRSLTDVSPRFDDVAHFTGAYSCALSGQVLAPCPPPARSRPPPPRRSRRIAKLAGAEVPGTLSYAVRSLLCKLGFASRPEDVDDAVYEGYVKSFDSQVDASRIQLIRSLSAGDLPPPAPSIEEVGAMGTVC